MRKILLGSVALAPLAFMSETSEVVLIKGADGKPVRVNKDDFDADQAGDKKMTLYRAEEAEQAVPGQTASPPPPGVTIPPAPSAPDFKGLNSGGDVNPTPLATDPATGAALPTVPAPNALLVATEGTGKNTRYFVTDATGNKITDRDGIDPKGYLTQQAAWDAILAQPH